MSTHTKKQRPDDDVHMAGSSTSSAPSAASISSFIKPPSSSPSSSSSFTNLLDHPSYDLTPLLSDYTGLAQIRRLVFIAERSPSHSIKAFQTAINKLKSGVNTTLYMETVSKARELVGDQLGDAYLLDNKWLTNTNRVQSDKINSAESQLNALKREGERDEIKTAYLTLADLYLQRGDATAALSKYLESKEYAGNTKETAYICLQVIRSSIYLGSLSHVKTQAQRIKAIPDLQKELAAPSTGFLANNPATTGPNAAAIMNAQVNAAMGLSHLRATSYRSAAQSFIAVTADLGSTFNDVISLKDVGTYGVICALSCFSRKEVKDQILTNPDFKKVLESAPLYKQLVENFYESNYAACFQALDGIKMDLLFDRSMAAHVSKLMREIRSKGLIQYFKPYSSVKLTEMAVNFATPLHILERNISELIVEGSISGRIDSATQVLYARHADERSQTFKRAIKMGNKYVRDGRSLLMRMSCIENEFILKSEKLEDKKRDAQREKEQAHREAMREAREGK